MSHSKAKIWIHAIFSTKHRMRLITSDVKNWLYGLITNELNKMGCPVKAINGVEDHIHILFVLNPNKALSDVMKQFKGSSSHTVNQSDKIPQKFAWQVGYSAYSVSESIVPKVVRYIEIQEEHHKKQSFMDEYAQFLRLHQLLEQGEDIFEDDEPQDKQDGNG